MMKYVKLGENTLYFSILKDLPYFVPTSNYYGMQVKSFDLDKTKMFTVRDVSANPPDYQHFIVTSTEGQESLEEAIVKFKPFGMWYLDIYAASASTISSIDTSTTLFRGLIFSEE